jgi:hypothetical protein
VIDEAARYRLHRRLEEVLGHEDASTLMTLLSQLERSTRSAELAAFSPSSRAEPDLHEHLERITRELIIWTCSMMALAAVVAFLAGRFL